MKSLICQLRQRFSLKSAAWLWLQAADFLHITKEQHLHTHGHRKDKQHDINRTQRQDQEAIRREGSP
jgi:hypothetical protein